jgi:hypothetical protein
VIAADGRLFFTFLATVSEVEFMELLKLRIVASCYGVRRFGCTAYAEDLSGELSKLETML